MKRTTIDDWMCWPKLHVPRHALFALTKGRVYWARECTEDPLEDIFAEHPHLRDEEVSFCAVSPGRMSEEVIRLAAANDIDIENIPGMWSVGPAELTLDALIVAPLNAWTWKRIHYEPDTYRDILADMRNELARLNTVANPYDVKRDAGRSAQAEQAYAARLNATYDWADEARDEARVRAAFQEWHAVYISRLAAWLDPRERMLRDWDVALQFERRLHETADALCDYVTGVSDADRYGLALAGYSGRLSSDDLCAPCAEAIIAQHHATARDTLKFAARPFRYTWEQLREQIPGPNLGWNQRRFGRADGQTRRAIRPEIVRAMMDGRVLDDWHMFAAGSERIVSAHGGKIVTCLGAVFATREQTRAAAQAIEDACGWTFGPARRGAAPQAVLKDWDDALQYEGLLREAETTTAKMEEAQGTE